MLLRATNAEEYAEWIKVLQHSIALQLTDSGREDESDYFGGGTGGAHITSASGLVAMLREVAGNHACADCQQQDPEWAVLNMGILICVRCSGIHRGLGVHVSKVRSLALDKWERQQIEVMKLIGNKRANETLWERKVPEEWQTKRATPDGENKAVEAWIKTKYVAKSFMVKASGTADELGQRLWAATRAKDYVEVLRLIASGADPNWPNQEEEHRTILHAILSYNNDMVDGENNNTNNSFTSSNSASAAVALELLLQNGGDINAKDDKGRTPLHYCALYGQVECAKVLWNKGAKLCKDGEGRSPTEVAEAHGQEVCAALMKSFEGEISQGEEMKRRSNTTGAGTEGLLELGVANSGSNSRMGKDLRKKRNKTLSTSSGSALAASLSGVGGGSQLFFDKTFASSSSSISTSPSASNVSSPSAGSSPSLLPSSGSGSGGGGSSTKPHLLSKIKGVTLRKKKGMISPYVQAAMAAGDGINSGSPGERSPGEESSSSLSELNNIHSSTPSSTVTIITPEATGTMESLTRTARALSEEEPASSSLSDCPASSPSGGRHKKRGISIHQSLRRHRVHSGDAILHHPSSSLSTDASASLPTSALGGIDSDTDTDIAYVNNRGELVLDGRSTSDAEDEFLTGGGVHDEEGEESFSNESSHSASPSLPLPPATATKRNKNSSPRWSRATKPATWTKKAPIPSIMKSPRRTPSFEPKEQTKKKAETDASDQTTDSGSESSKEQKHKKKKKVKRKGSGGSEGVEKETSTPFPGIRHHDLTSSLLQLDTSPLSFDVDPSDATAPKNHKKKEKRTKRKGEKDKSDSSKRKSLAPTSATATALHHVLVGPELGNSPLQLRRTVSQPSEVHAKIVTSSPPASSSSKPTISSKLAWRRSKEIKNNEGGGTSSGEGEGRRPTANGEEPMLGAERRREEPMEQQPPEDSG
ncbi:putative ADP-ribosylation factor GTPase-activating protein AGD15 isoform X1 [Balamuthia mandrillaris]